MTDTQIETFWSEIEQIRQRHKMFFPEEQKDFIRLSNDPDAASLTFLPGYDLPECITLEIEFCYKLVADT